MTTDHWRRLSPSGWRVGDLLSGGLAIVGAATAAAALLVLAVRAALRVEIRWDMWGYHVAFAADRAGRAISYTVNERYTAWLEGYPPLVHWLQGVLWRATGTLNATGVVGMLALLAWVVAVGLLLRGRWWVAVLIALTAPMVVIHSASSYIDLFGNAWLAIAMLGVLQQWLSPTRATRATDVAIGVATSAAAWSKYQMLPLVLATAVAWALTTWHRSYRQSRARNAAAMSATAASPTMRSSARGARHNTSWLPLVVCVCLALVPYAKNTVLYGNPLWPFRAPVIGAAVPYSLDAIEETHAQHRPPQLADRSQPELFVRSLFEIDHPRRYPNRPRWIIDSGNARETLRMGGFWGVGSALYLTLFLALLVAVHGPRGTIAGVAFVALLAALSLLPQSHELRYFLFIPLVWGGGIAMLLPVLSARVPRGAMAVQLLTIGLFAYMVSENRMHYRWERVRYADAARIWGMDGWWRRLTPGQRYCAVDMVPTAIFLAGPTLTEFTIVDRSDQALCPMGSVALRRDGSMRLVRGGQGP